MREYGEAQLRAGRQTVADFIENTAAEELARRAALAEVPDAANASDSDTATNQGDGIAGSGLTWLRFEYFENFERVL